MYPRLVDSGEQQEHSSLQFPLLIVATVVMLMLLCAGEAQAQAIKVTLPEGVTSQMIFDGQELFGGAAGCSECHGWPAWGGEQGPSLKDSTWLQTRGDYQELVQLIKHGVPKHEALTEEEMPAVGGKDLSDEQVAALAAYVWSVSRQKTFDPTLGIRTPRQLPPGVTEAVIADGKRVYSGKGLCFLCHGAVPQGGIGPNLSDSTWLRSSGRYEEIVSQVFSGTSREDSKTGIAMPPRGGSKISDEEVRAVAAYIWAISHPDAGP